MGPHNAAWVQVYLGTYAVGVLAAGRLALMSMQRGSCPKTPFTGPSQSVCTWTARCPSAADPSAWSHSDVHLSLPLPDPGTLNRGCPQ